MGEQRETFEAVADLYAEVRPQVPPPAVEALWTWLDRPRGRRVLEVGCGTGLLTKHLAARGAQVTALDPGARLLGVCARAVAGQDVTLVERTFEAWPTPAEPFDALTACQAAHWIDPAVFLDRSAAALKPGGRLGLLWHVDTSRGSAFWQATQPLYDRFLPDAPDKPPQTIPLHVEAYQAALAADARFTVPPPERWTWSRTFDEERYVLLLRTHSPVNMLGEADREAFLAGHRPLIRACGGEVTRTYETILVRARRA